MAAAARRWQDELEAGTRTALDAVDDAERDGFTVNQGYRCTDTRRSATAAEFAQRAAAAEAHANYIRHHVATLVANEARITGELKAMTAGWGTLTFPESGGGVKAQPVDRTFKQGPDQPTPDPVSKLGLPNYSPGSLSDEEARAVYARGEPQMRQLNEEMIEQGVSPEHRARIMHEQRNTLRTWCRELMRDRAAADWLAENRPNQTWEQAMQKQISRGKQGDAIYEGIIESSTRSNPGVNEATGVDPEHPPPLPPVLPSAPIESAGPGTAPTISSPPTLPPVLDHPPTVVPPTVLDQPSTPVPPTVLDHPPLPSWLQDPSPPGFDVHPSEPPTFAPLDTPGDIIPLPQHGPPITLHMPDLHAPDMQLSPQQQQSLLTDLGAAGILALLAAGVLVLA